MKNTILYLIIVLLSILLISAFVKFSNAKKEAIIYKDQAQRYKSYEESIKNNSSNKEQNRFKNIEDLIENNDYESAIKLINVKTIGNTSSDLINRFIFYWEYFNSSNDFLEKSYILDKIGDLYKEMRINDKSILCYRKSLEYNPANKRIADKANQLYDISLRDDVQKYSNLPESSAWVVFNDDQQLDESQKEYSLNSKIHKMIMVHQSKIYISLSDKYVDEYWCKQYNKFILIYCENMLGDYYSDLEELNTNDIDRIKPNGYIEWYDQNSLKYKGMIFHRDDVYFGQLGI